jgi:phage replication initiation protein
MNFDHKRQSAIIIDHLAFSVPMVEMRHLSNSGGEIGKFWKSFPKKNWKNVKDSDLKTKLIEDYQAEYQNVCLERFRQFCDRIMGLRLGNFRERGIHGYTNSAKILAKNAPIELGFIGFGGNNNTIYFQLSGQGCKHVFEKITPFQLHYWLCKVLSIKKLNRIDLAYDDFDGNYSVDYAKKAYDDDAFKNPRGGAYPICTVIESRKGRDVAGSTFAVGSRKSGVYWRIYDKALEQGIQGETWNRNEVELKKCSSDVLENPAAAFAGLNRFSSSVNLENGLSFKSLIKKTTLEFNSRIRWAKRQCGRTVSDVLESFGGDVYATLGAICDSRGGKFCLPDTQAMLLNHHYYEVEKNGCT